MNLKTAFLLITSVLLLPLTGRAETRVTAWATASEYSSESAYPPFWDGFSTDDDLILGMTPSSSTGAFAPYPGTNATAFNDGILGDIPTPPSSDYSLFSGVGDFGGTELVFDFVSPVHISSIAYYGGWLDDGRATVSVTVSYSTDNGATYIPLLDAVDGGTYGVWGDDDPPFAGNENLATTFTRVLGGIGPISNYVNVHDDTYSYLGMDAAITNVKFNFGAVPNGWSGLEELVVTGVAVPEPGTWGLCLSAGLLGACVARRRCRRA